MRLLTVTGCSTSVGARLSGIVEKAAERRQVELYFHYHAPAEYVASGADAFAPAMLLPCMRAGEPLQIDARLSPQLCFNLPRIRDIFHTWWPQFARCEIQVTPGGVPAPPPPRAATFFSAGVDSFYTLLKHRAGAGLLPAPLTHLIFVRGVENKLHSAVGVEMSERWVREIAAATGVEAIVGETNVRKMMQGKEAAPQWERYYLGSALAAAALPLSPALSFVCIPSGDSYNNLIAWGTTALADEMYSTEGLRVIHDGAELTRAGKLAKILEWDRDLVLRYLRVCLDNRGGAFNCGRCYKCVRTAVALRLLGAWEEARTFPLKDTSHWERTMQTDHLTMTEDNLALATERGGDVQLLAMLRRVVRRRRRRAAVAQLIADSPLEPWLPAIRRLSASLPRLSLRAMMSGTVKEHPR